MPGSQISEMTLLSTDIAVAEIEQRLPATPQAFWKRADVWLALALTLAAPLGYALYTGHIWEDYFITFRHSQHLCEGKGLVYNVGERVHGFTSPLGVLLPALCYVITGKTSYVPALWLFRALCIAAFVGGGLLVLRRLQDASSPALVRYAFVFAYALDAKSVAFTANGMETAFMLLFVGLGIFLWGRSSQRAWWLRGLAWAGLMWTRPDGCLYIAVLCLGELLFAETCKEKLLKSFARSGLLATAVYGPWVVFCFWYYGSPIPQTVRAKAPTLLGSGWDIAWAILQRIPTRAAAAYGPFYFPVLWQNGPFWLYPFTYALGTVALIYWLLPVRDQLGRIASFCFMILCVYMAYVEPVFPWYLPPVALFGSVALCHAFSRLAPIAARLLGRLGSLNRSLVSPATTVFAILCLAGGVAVGIAVEDRITVRQVYLQQRYIEWGNRAQIGLWLKEHAHPDETVFLEPIGYVGYFSDAHIRDWPGLVSPDVTLLRKKQIGFRTIVNDLAPAWCLYRPHEVKDILESNLQFLPNYVPVKVFDVRPKLKGHGTVHGIDYLMLDAVYLLFRRKTGPFANSVPAEFRESAKECEAYMAPLMPPKEAVAKK
jgi:hypothetical protein